MAFTVLVMLQMFNVMNTRSEKTSLFKLGVFSNRYLVLAIISSILLQFAIIYTPLSRFLKTAPLSFFDWIIIILVSSSVLIVGEIVKYVYNKINKQSLNN